MGSTLGVVSMMLVGRGWMQSTEISRITCVFGMMLCHSLLAHNKP